MQRKNNPGLAVALFLQVSNFYCLCLLLHNLNTKKLAGARGKPLITGRRNDIRAGILMVYKSMPLIDIQQSIKIKARKFTLLKKFQHLFCLTNKAGCRLDTFLPLFNHIRMTLHSYDSW